MGLSGTLGGMAQDRLLTPTEVGAMFKVDAKTVTRWAHAGKLSFTRTVGGHLRLYEAEVTELLAAGFTPRMT
jgi:excisionase family DNA binding protein